MTARFITRCLSGQRSLDVPLTEMGLQPALLQKSAVSCVFCNVFAAEPEKES